MPPIEVVEFQAALDALDRWCFEAWPEVVMLLRPHRPFEFYPWTLPACTMVVVSQLRGRLQVRPIRMASNDDGDTLAGGGDC
jgi:hypothetical protein